MNLSLRLGLAASFFALAACSASTSSEPSATSDSHLESPAANSDKGDEGDSCEKASDCMDGLTCGPAAKTSSYTGNLCQAKADAGSDAGSDAGADAGAKGDEGDACDTASDCIDGLACGPAAKTSSYTGNLCQQPKGGEGDFCDTTDDCGDGLSCTAPKKGSMSTGSTCE